jgi:hypothetical protein
MRPQFFLLPLYEELLLHHRGREHERGVSAVHGRDEVNKVTQEHDKVMIKIR